MEPGTSRCSVIRPVQRTRTDRRGELWLGTVDSAKDRCPAWAMWGRRLQLLVKGRRQEISREGGLQSQTSSKTTRSPSCGCPAWARRTDLNAECLWRPFQGHKAVASRRKAGLFPGSWGCSDGASGPRWSRTGGGGGERLLTANSWEAGPLPSTTALPDARGLEPRSGNSGPPASRVAEAPRRHFPEGTDKLSCWEVPGKDSPRAGSGHGMVCERRRLGNSDAEVRVPLGWVQGLQGFPIDRRGS